MNEWKMWLFFLQIYQLWWESDINPDLANALAQSSEPLTDGGHWGSAGAVTVSSEAWGCTDKEHWDSVGLVSALVTSKNAAAALKADVMREAAVTLCAPPDMAFSLYTPRPRCSHSCCLYTWSVNMLAHSLCFLPMWNMPALNSLAWNFGYSVNDCSHTYYTWHHPVQVLYILKSWTILVKGWVISFWPRFILIDLNPASALCSNLSSRGYRDRTPPEEEGMSQVMS